MHPVERARRAAVGVDHRLAGRISSVERGRAELLGARDERSGGMGRGRTVNEGGRDLLQRGRRWSDGGGCVYLE